jgi:hypothetical protein
MAGLSFTSMRFYALYMGKLTFDCIDPSLLKGAMIKSAMNPLLNVIAVLLAGVNTTASLVLYVAIPMLFFVPTRLERSTVSKGRSNLSQDVPITLKSSQGHRYCLREGVSRKPLRDKRRR